MNMLHSRESNDQATWSRLIATSHTQDGLTIADIRAKAMRSLERFQRATMQRIAVTGISLPPAIEFTGTAFALITGVARDAGQFQAAAAGGGTLLGEKHSEKDLALDRWVGCAGVRGCAGVHQSRGCVCWGAGSASG